MISFIKRHKGVVALALLFPFLLNLLVAIPTPANWPVMGEASDWLLFWATYITSLASFAMVMATYKSLEESRRQWNEAHTAHIVATAYQDKYHQVFLRISNMSSVGIMLQSLQLNPEPSNNVKKLFCIVKSYETLDNYTKWQHTYESQYIVIKPFEYQDILILQQFPRRMEDELNVVIRYNNTQESVIIDLSNIVIIQDNGKRGE